ncbi:winged helix-turn-helix domain-containing protein [Streptomyces pseudogriseolus]
MSGTAESALRNFGVSQCSQVGQVGQTSNLAVPPVVQFKGGNGTVGQLGHRLSGAALRASWHSWQRVVEVLRGVGVSEASPRGTYLVISEKLRERIGADENAEVLPSEADLMREHSVGRNTVRRALKVLEAEGVLESAPGIGWRIVRGGDCRSLAEPRWNTRFKRATSTKTRSLG